MTDELVHLQVADAVATITLDSEHNRNALSRQLVAELVGHLTRQMRMSRCAPCSCDRPAACSAPALTCQRPRTAPRRTPR